MRFVEYAAASEFALPFALGSHSRMLTVPTSRVEMTILLVHPGHPIDTIDRAIESANQTQDPVHHAEDPFDAIEWCRQ